jgi:hypothetical protein
MKNNDKQRLQNAYENEDGTFNVGEHKSLSYDEFKKLQAIQGSRWLIFRAPDSPHPKNPNTINFLNAM